MVWDDLWVCEYCGLVQDIVLWRVLLSSVSSHYHSYWTDPGDLPRDWAGNSPQLPSPASLHWVFSFKMKNKWFSVGAFKAHLHTAWTSRQSERKLIELLGKCAPELLQYRTLEMSEWNTRSSMICWRYDTWCLGFTSPFRQPSGKKSHSDYRTITVDFIWTYQCYNLLALINVIRRFLASINKWWQNKCRTLKTTSSEG